MLDPRESPEEIKRRKVVLCPQESPEDQEQGGGAGLRKLDLSFASVVLQQQFYEHCAYDCSAPQLKQQLRGTEFGGIRKH